MDTDMRVKILDIGMGDAYRNDRDDLVGMTGTMIKLHAIWDDGCIAGDIRLNNSPRAFPFDVYTFHRVKVTTKVAS